MNLLEEPEERLERYPVKRLWGMYEACDRRDGEPIKKQEIKAALIRKGAWTDKKVDRR